LVYIGNWKITPKWSLLPEIQIRQSDVVGQNMQRLYRLGLSRSINTNTSIAVGYMYAWTFPYGELPAKTSFPENRTWQQLQMTGTSGIFETVTRFRLEQRWVNAPVAVSNGYAAGEAVYTNRIRVMNRFSFPLTGKKIQDKSVYLSVFNELMINFGKKVALNIFDQNRAFLGLGYKLPKFGRIELGYLNQRVFKGDAKTIEQNHTISLWLLQSLNLQKTKQS
jgi:hypothetical protein